MPIKKPTKKRRDISRYRDKIVSIEFMQYPQRHFIVTLEYKGRKLKGEIFNEMHINMYNSNEQLKRTKGFYAIANTILKQLENQQLKINI